MDSLITAAARALAAGDPLGALKRGALRDDAPAAALRGIARAQLGELRGARGRRRRGGDRPGLARPGRAREDTRRGTGDARSARRPAERRARTPPRGPAP